PTGKEEAAFRSEEGRGILFQHLMFRVIAAQQPRSARTNRNAARQRVNDGYFELGAARQPEVIIGREIMAAPWSEAPPLLIALKVEEMSVEVRKQRTAYTVAHRA